MGAYADARTRSLTDPSGFWLDAASAVAWDTPPSIGLDDSAAPLYRWFSDGALNTRVVAPPVAGPRRCTSTSTSGTSPMIASPMFSL